MKDEKDFKENEKEEKQTSSIKATNPEQNENKKDEFALMRDEKNLKTNTKEINEESKI